MSELFLLGAGFSRCAGVPTNSELLPHAIEELVKKTRNYWQVDLNPETELTDILRHKNADYIMAEFFLYRTFHLIPLKSDIESYLDTCRIFLKGNSGIRFEEMGSEEAKLWRDLVDKKSLCPTEIEDALHEAVRKAISQHPKNAEDAVYIERFADFCDRNGCEVFTTNFDTLIERACGGLHLIPSVAGTRLSGYSQTADRRKANFVIHKLHGSLDWDIYSDPIEGPITKYEEKLTRNLETGGIQNIGLDNPGKLGIALMLIPGLVELDRLFSEAKKITAIGTSLSDTHIKSILLNRLYSPGYEIVFIDPSEAPFNGFNRVNETVQRASGGSSKMTHKKMCAMEYCINHLGANG
jgi:hypothetical protein